MPINVTKLTDESLMQWACGLTIDSDSKISLNNIYKCEHSPMRTQLFKVEMLDIPVFVSQHFRTHSVGVTHFIKSLRDDRCGDGKANRLTPTNHGMLINAQGLINLARKRLCFKSHIDTVRLMSLIRVKVGKVDPALMDHMVPECIYRGSCHEQVSCGYNKL